MDDKVYLGCLGLEAIFTAVQPYQIFQWISLIITIVSALFGLIFKIVTWYKKSKEDGKITKEEIEEGIKIVSEGTKEIKDAADKASEEMKDKN